MGYDESQYSLPRWMDLSVSRQGLFDDTFRKTPTEGWMFLPLVEYHGGGGAAAFEPLTNNSKVNLKYERNVKMHFTVPSKTVNIFSMIMSLVQLRCWNVEV